MIKLIKLIFLVLLFFVGIYLSMENREPTVLLYFGYKTPPIELYLLIWLSVFIGILVSGIGFMMDQRSLKKVVRQKERDIESLEKEIREIQEK